MPECALAGYQITCSQNMHKHHIINRSKARGNSVVRQELDCDELIADVCSKHNVSRIADTKECRSLLLWQKADPSNKVIVSEFLHKLIEKYGLIGVQREIWKKNSKAKEMSFKYLTDNFEVPIELD